MIGALGQPALLLSPGLHVLRPPRAPLCLPAQQRVPRITRAAAGAGAGHDASADGSFSPSPRASGAQVGPIGGETFSFVDASLPQRTGSQAPVRPSQQPHFAPGGGKAGTAGLFPLTGSRNKGTSSSSSTGRSSATTTTTTSTSTTTATNSADGGPAEGAAPTGVTSASPHISAPPPSSTPISTSSSDGSSNGNGANNKPSPEESVAAALARAQDALQRVETSLESIEDLPSARPPSQLDRVFSLIRTAVVVCALSTALVASQAFGLAVQLLSAFACSVAVAWWGWAKRSLSASGALAALVVGTGTIGCSLRFGATLLAFFFSCSKLTSFKDELKEGLDDAHKVNGQRDWRQVACNGAVPTLLAVAYGVLVGCVDVPFGPSPAMEAWRAKAATLLGGAFLGYYACCCGDTWASELGPLSSDTPRLITTLRPVRRGTNGGVTLLGLSASILGGVFVGAVFYAAAVVSPTLWVLEGAQQAAVGQWRLVPLGLMAGLVGSVLDSVLGATVQYTGYNRLTGRVTSTPGPDVTHISGVKVLDNNTVNLLSASITSALTAGAALKMFGF